jgi:hypothetical protein
MNLIGDNDIPPTFLVSLLYTVQINIGSFYTSRPKQPQAAVSNFRALTGNGTRWTLFGHIFNNLEMWSNWKWLVLSVQ